MRIRHVVAREILSSALMCSLLFAGPASVAAGQPLQLGPGPHLFIDDYLIHESEGLVRTMHQPRKSPDPILKDQAWYKQALWHLKVIHDQDTKRFRMWFVATQKGLPAL